MDQKRMQNRQKVIWFIVQTNCYFAVLIFFVCSFMLFQGENGIFNLNTNLYGVISNNLRMSALNLMVLEISIWSFCLLKNDYFAVALLGAFQLCIIVFLQIYNQLNQVDINSGFNFILFYSGLSHFLFGLYIYFFKPAES